jgi:hypothetical protein
MHARFIGWLGRLFWESWEGGLGGITMVGLAFVYSLVLYYGGIVVYFIQPHVNILYKGSSAFI